MYARVYNLGGATLPMVTIDWLPWLSLSRCNEEGRRCQSEGVLGDIFSVLTRTFNSTYFVDADPNDDWGVVPKSGSYFDANVTFSGVYKSVVDNDYDVSACGWTHTLGRAIWADFTMR